MPPEELVRGAHANFFGRQRLPAEPRPDPKSRPGRSILLGMSGKREVEVKFQVEDRGTLVERLKSLGFSEVTGRTHEMNMLYDLPGGRLRRR